ncbi:uncharacterized protein CEXT_301071 [Caerostris extrusa]|uniref:Uncharacterized protein n=1 Tax=Caerostris extrusa TaxID=172846 RepID=A0AAV4MQG4_CAEEX|nr:uncharacterized protein CEXT_301071 [Caerostris extrusa]
MFLLPVIRMTLNIEVGEYHPEHLSRGAQIAIHSPYNVPSPMSDGHLLNLGAIYRFYIKLTSLQLLPTPYKVVVKRLYVRVVRKWRKRSCYTKMCKEKCKLDKSLQYYSCADKSINYPHNESLCEFANIIKFKTTCMYCLTEIPQFHQKWAPMCSKACSMPCSISKFEFDVQVSNSEGHRQKKFIVLKYCRSTVPTVPDSRQSGKMGSKHDMTPFIGFDFKSQFSNRRFKFNHMGCGNPELDRRLRGSLAGNIPPARVRLLEIGMFRFVAYLRKKTTLKNKKKMKKTYIPDPSRKALYLSKIHRRH